MAHSFEIFEVSRVASSRRLRTPVYLRPAMTAAGVSSPWIRCVSAPSVFRKSLALIATLPPSEVAGTSAMAKKETRTTRRRAKIELFPL
jgi:hypothetical protein